MTQKKKLPIKNDFFDDEMDDLFCVNPLIKKKTYNIADQYVFYIYDEIGPVDNYIDLIHTLDSSPEGTVIHIRLATPGGSFDTMIAILHAMLRTEATVITHADSDIASAGNFIFLAGHHMMVYPYSSFMFHTVSSGLYGKLQENTSNLDSLVKRSKRLIKEYLYPVLTEVEIDQMNDGKDFYFEADDMMKRLDRIRELEEAEVNKKPSTKKRAPKKNV